MNNLNKELPRLFQQIPVYGFGTLPELNKVFNEYLTILLQMTSSDLSNETLDKLFINACKIQRLIDGAMRAETPKAVEFHFDRASNLLGLDMETLLGVLDPTFHVSPVPA